MHRREQLLALAVLAVLTGGVVTVQTAADQEVEPQPAAQVATPTPVRTTARPTPAPRPKPVAASPLRRTPVAPAPPLTGCPVPKRPSTGGTPKPMKPPIVADASLPQPIPVTGKAAGLGVVRGKGLWVTPWPKTVVDSRALVAKAKRAGVTSLWVRTGGSRQGFYGDRFLPELVPLAHASGIAVIAWDFPFLSDPMADAARAKQALDLGIDAFSPDVETAAEGTYATPRRLAVYLSMVRAYAGDRPVVATVPRPTKLRATFPYKTFVPYADVFAPMVYWSCREPGAVVLESLRKLGAMLPVAPIGQGYDMGSEGGRVGVPSRLETLRFLDVARRGGAIGASLWTVEAAGAGQLQALRDYSWATASYR